MSEKLKKLFAVEPFYCGVLMFGLGKVRVEQAVSILTEMAFFFGGCGRVKPFKRESF